ncbi:hypothetical protein BCR42DRAFT_19442 [Absidia repens]|uniref:magnesium chelatase n=1 Tax=Absidia repens TaxID=90262 RepID=A0A1X2J2R7_9FUNG|nr:hypothetical protein BCR42DRAFT_19442 [Absidia repens]
MAEQDSREWIKQRMAILRKKSGFGFNQDVFISILLCLVSGKGKHLILTAPSNRLPMVAQMATEICRCLFGFTTANVTCQQDQTVMDFVHGLFTSTFDDDDRFPTATTATSSNSHYDTGEARGRISSTATATMTRRSHENPAVHHKKSSSRLSNSTTTTTAAATATNTNKDTLFHTTSASSPISPVDFTVRGSQGMNMNNSNNGGPSANLHRSLQDRHTMFSTFGNTNPPSFSSLQQQQTSSTHRKNTGMAFSTINNGDRKRMTSSSLAGPPMGLSAATTSSMTHRLAQVLIVQQLDEANDLVQAALLELIVTKEIRMMNVRYNTPKPYFLTIAILPESGCHHTISSPLLDHFFISYHCKEELFQQQQQQQQPSSTLTSAPAPSFSLHQDQPHPFYYRRACLLRHDEIKGLAEQASKVHINIDITRYIRDIIVGVRTHPLVSGGLTARTSQDLVTVTRSLAALFRRNFLTPDLVAVAVEKVVGHRLRLNLQETNLSNKNGDEDDMVSVAGMNEQATISDIVAEILRIVYAPV